ncbi:MAG: hypothetical protein JSS34_06525 [Proteobacteria bacterium]|nr:hypothetical protein [Pseudomonadota bacterium]
MKKLSTFILKLLKEKILLLLHVFILIALQDIVFAMSSEDFEFLRENDSAFFTQTHKPQVFELQNQKAYISCETLEKAERNYLVPSIYGYDSIDGYQEDMVEIYRTGTRASGIFIDLYSSALLSQCVYEVQNPLQRQNSTAVLSKDYSFCDRILRKLKCLSSVYPAKIKLYDINLVRRFKEKRDYKENICFDMMDSNVSLLHPLKFLSSDIPPQQPRPPATRLRDTEIHKDINVKKWLWSSPLKRKQIKLFMKLNTQYGDELRNYEFHIPELEEMFDTIGYFFERSFVFKEKTENKNKIEGLLKELKDLHKQKKLSFPRYKIFLLGTQILLSSQERDPASEFLSDCKTRPHKFWWYPDHLVLILGSNIDPTSILSLELGIKKLEKKITKRKGDKIRVYNNVLKQHIEDGRSIPILGTNPAFGFTDAIYAILNGLRPYGVSFNRAQLHNTFYTELVDALIHDLIHNNYVMDVQESYETIITEEGTTFMDLLRFLYNSSFDEDVGTYQRTHYGLFLLLHDPDPVQFNRLYRELSFQLLDTETHLERPDVKSSESSEAEALTPRFRDHKKLSKGYGNYNQFILAVKNLIALTLRKYDLTDKSKEAYHPNEMRVALVDSFRYLKEIGLDVTEEQINLFDPHYDLSMEEATYLKTQLQEKLNFLFVDFLFSNPVFKKGYFLIPISSS